MAEGVADEEEVPELVAAGRVEVTTGDVELTLAVEAPCWTSKYVDYSPRWWRMCNTVIVQLTATIGPRLLLATY